MGNAKFVRHIYKVERALKSYRVYRLESTQFGSAKLTSELRIEKFRGYSAAKGITHYLRLRNTSNWATCEKVTGLRFAGKKGVYEGNRNNGSKSLILFQFQPDSNQLIIDVFPEFYPSHKGILQKIVETHSYHL